MPPKLIFTFKDLSHFVEKDLHFLEAQFDLITFQSRFSKSVYSFIYEFIRQFCFFIRHIWKADIIFCWFADYHSFLPVLLARIFRKRSYIVLGGYDVKSIPEIGYGSFSKPFRAFCARYSIQHATLNLPVTASLVKEAKNYVRDFNFEIIPTGYDPGLYNSSKTKEKTVLTVSITNNYQRFQIKGIDRFIELAELLPDFTFLIIGIEKGIESLLMNVPENLKWLPPQNHNKIIYEYQQAMFYAQFSRSEGMPNTICEAMLSACIPMGLKVGGIPDIIGGDGILNDSWDPGYFKDAIEKNAGNKILGTRARERIVELFSIERREKSLLEILMP